MVMVAFSTRDERNFWQIWRGPADALQQVAHNENCTCTSACRNKKLFPSRWIVRLEDWRKIWGKKGKEIWYKRPFD